jgi:hypothetical protein
VLRCGILAWLHGFRPALAMTAGSVSLRSWD